METFKGTEVWIYDLQLERKIKCFSKKYAMNLLRNHGAWKHSTVPYDSQVYREFSLKTKTDVAWGGKFLVAENEAALDEKILKRKQKAKARVPKIGKTCVLVDLKTGRCEGFISLKNLKEYFKANRPTLNLAENIFLKEQLQQDCGLLEKDVYFYRVGKCVPHFPVDDVLKNFMQKLKEGKKAAKEIAKKPSVQSSWEKHLSGA